MKAVLFLVAAAAAAQAPPPPVSPARQFAEMKIFDAAGSPLRTPREDWTSARQRVASDPAWSAWLQKQRAEVDDWIANRRDRGDSREYRAKEIEKRDDNHIPAEDPIVFFEVQPGDASEFAGVLHVRGVRVDQFKVLRTESPAVPNAIAAFMLYLRDSTGSIPHVYFGWSEGNPLVYLARYVLFGEGDTAPVTHEVLRQAEPDPGRRPAVHVGG